MYYFNGVKFLFALFYEKKKLLKSIVLGAQTKLHKNIMVQI